MIASLALAAVLGTVPTSSTTLAKYRQAAILNAAAAERALGARDACLQELEVERGLFPIAPEASPTSPLPAVLYGLAGLGLGIAVGAIAMAAALGDQP